MAKELEDAVVNLDKKKILEICKRRNIPMPEDDIPFWGGIHKIRLYVESATDEQKEASKNWLIKHGLIPAIYIEN